jgi:hypothetical protein
MGPIEVAAVAYVVVVWPTMVAVNVLKRKWGFTVIAVLHGPLALVGVSRLARPGSWWYRKRYDDDKRARADARYADGRYWPRPDSPRPRIGGLMPEPRRVD